MATILGLALKVTADAANVPKALTPAERALESLGKKSEQVTRIFDQFAGTSDAAARAQAASVKSFEDLNRQLSSGQITAAEFAESFARLAEEAQREAAALERAAKVTEANITPMQRYNREVSLLTEDLQAGRISQEVFDSALAKATASFTKAESAAVGYDKAVEAAGDGGALKFNELSGILSALPGPIGNVAGRLSGLASAGEGLSRIFSGGLSQGLSSIGTSVAGLVNPFTVGVAAVAGFGAAAVAITKGLIDLESRVEALGNAALRLGTDFQTIEILGEAARRTGQSIDTVAAGLQKFNVNLDEARSGSGKAAEAFAALGISQEQLRTTDPTTLAQQTAAALQQIEDPARRAALAVETFGKQGLTLLPTFNAIGEGTDALERFSATIDGVDRERISSLGQSFDDVKTSIMGLSQNLLLPFAGLVEGIASAIADTIGAITNIVEPIGDLLTPLLDSFGVTFTQIGEVIFNVGTIVSRVLSVSLTPFINLFTALSPAISPINAVLTGVNVVLEGMIAIIDGVIERWNNFVSSIPLVGEYMKVNVNDTEVAVGQVRGELADPIEVKVDNNAAKAVESVRAELSKAIDESAQFGQAGFDAALEYQNAIDELQRQFDAGILNEEAFKRAAEQANEAYREQVDTIKDATAEAERKAKAEADAAQKRIDDDQKIVDGLLRQREIDEQFGGDSGRAKAAENVAAIEREIARTEEEIRQARAAGDTEAADAAAARLAELDQVAAKERDIASGAAQEREKQAEEEKKRLEQRQKAEEQINKQIADAYEKYSERAIQIESDRIERLSEVQGGAVKVGDLRSTEGASTFLNLAGGKMDPAIEEYRKQLGELKGMRRDLQKLEAQKVEILAGNG